MSTIRHKSAPRKTPTTQDGIKLCKCGCGKQVPKGRLSWAGDDCVHEWKIRNQAAYARAEVFKRDRGICALCGIDASRAERRFREARHDNVVRRVHPNYRRPQVKLRHGEYAWAYRLARWWLSRTEARLSKAERGATRRIERMKAEGWPVHLRSSWWQADHIVPVAEGGGQCGLDNLRTLCWRCHKTETAALRKRFSEKRKQSTISPLPRLADADRRHSRWRPTAQS